MERSIKYLWILPLILFGCSQTYHLADEQVKTYRITEKTVDNAEDSDVEQMIRPYRDQLASEMNQMIGLVASPWKRTMENQPWEIL